MFYKKIVAMDTAVPSSSAKMHFSNTELFICLVTDPHIKDPDAELCENETVMQKLESNLSFSM